MISAPLFPETSQTVVSRRHNTAYDNRRETLAVEMVPRVVLNPCVQARHGLSTTRGTRSPASFEGNSAATHMPPVDPASVGVDGVAGVVSVAVGAAAGADGIATGLAAATGFGAAFFVVFFTTFFGEAFCAAPFFTNLAALGEAFLATFLAAFFTTFFAAFFELFFAAFFAFFAMRRSRSSTAQRVWPASQQPKFDFTSQAAHATLLTASLVSSSPRRLADCTRRSQVGDVFVVRTLMPDVQDRRLLGRAAGDAAGFVGEDFDRFVAGSGRSPEGSTSGSSRLRWRPASRRFRRSRRPGSCRSRPACFIASRAAGAL